MDITAAIQNLMTDLTPQEKAVIKKELAVYLNHLLINDFPALVQILYRVDVSEQKLKTVLRENLQADAGDLMAELIISRQKEKIIARQSLNINGASPDEERL